MYSIPPELAESQNVAPENKYLYTWIPSYLHDSCVTLINKRSAGVFSHIVEEELPEPFPFAIGNDHLHKGATFGLNDLWDTVVALRMQSLWTQRQVIKGDGGDIYELENGNLVIRTANVSLHGNFRGLLIQLEVDHTKLTASDPEQIFKDLLAKYEIPKGKICYKVIDCNNFDEFADLALQYSEILSF